MMDRKSLNLDELNTCQNLMGFTCCGVCRLYIRKVQESGYQFNSILKEEDSTSSALWLWLLAARFRRYLAQNARPFELYCKPFLSFCLLYEILEYTKRALNRVSKREVLEISKSFSTMLSANWRTSFRENESRTDITARQFSIGKKSQSKLD